MSSSSKRNNRPTNATTDHELPSSPWMWVMNAGLLLIVAGTALPLFNVDSSAFRYIYTAGALIALIGRIFSPRYKGSIFRVRRLHHISFWSCVIFCVGAFFMWYGGRGTTDWLAFTLAGGILQIYASVMITRTIEKEAARKDSGKKK